MISLSINSAYFVLQLALFTMGGLLLMLIVLSLIHVLVMTFLSESKVFVFARNVIMNQAINSFLMLSQNLQNHSVKVNVLFQHLQN